MLSSARYVRYLTSATTAESRSLIRCILPASWRKHTKQRNQALTVDVEGVSRKGDEDASEMTRWAVAGRGITDGVGFAVGRNRV
jgi:hypothetical protein